MARSQTMIFRLAFIGALAAITYLATTRHDYPVVKDISDKANHILAFYALTLLVDFSFPEEPLGFSKVAALLVYGLSIEVVQSFLPHRSASVLDVIADGVGIAAYRFSLPALRRIPLLCRRWTQAP
jgi:VanZ family protein